jgi:hypothetical protein
MSSVVLVRGHLDSSSMRKMGVGVASAPYQLVGQMIANSLDAGARTIAIMIDKHGAFVECADDGAGMQQDDWSKFIGMGDESKATDQHTIGENGTGHTAYWMAFEQVDVWTSWAGSPSCHHLGYTYNQAWEFSQAGAQGGIPVQATPKTAKGAKVKATGTVIRLSNPWKNENAIRVLPGTVMRDIARVLSPWHLDMVTINGAKPKIDFPKGEFYRALDEVPGVGQVEIIAGFADSQVKDHDHSWGTWGAHVCSHSELIEQLPTRLAQAFAPELLHPQVWFMVRVHAWKGFEGKHTRRFFKPTLFQDASFELVVRHLHTMLVPEIRKRTRIDVREQSDANQVIDRVIERLVQTIGEPETRNKPKRKPTTALAFKPARVRLLCGASYQFDILNADAQGTYELNASTAGGSILIGDKWLTGTKAQVTLTGPTQISYKAGAMEGHRFRMRLTQVGIPEGDIVPTADCEIRLDKSAAFSIVPAELVLEPGETGRVSIANDDGKTGLVWETSKKGRIKPEPDGRSAEVTAPMEPGNYTISCLAQDGDRAEARLSVRIPPPPTDGDGPGILRKRLIVDGVTFEVMMLHDKETSRTTQLTMCSQGGSANTFWIWFNFDAPEAREAANAKNGSLDRLVNHEVVTVIATKLAERESRSRAPGMPVTVQEVFLKRDQIMARVYTLSA